MSEQIIGFNKAVAALRKWSENFLSKETNELLIGAANDLEANRDIILAEDKEPTEITPKETSVAQRQSSLTSKSRKPLQNCDK